MEIIVNCAMPSDEIGEVTEKSEEATVNIVHIETMGIMAPKGKEGIAWGNQCPTILCIWPQLGERMDENGSAQFVRMVNTKGILPIYIYMEEEGIWSAQTMWVDLDY